VAALQSGAKVKCMLIILPSVIAAVLSDDSSSLSVFHSHHFIIDINSLQCLRLDASHTVVPCLQ